MMFAQKYFSKSMKNLKLFCIISTLSIYFKGYSQNTAEYYLNQGKINYNIANYDKAILDFTKSLELNTNCFECYYLRGICFGHSKSSTADENKKNAILDFNSALKIDSNCAKCYDQIAWYYSQKEDLKDFRKYIYLELKSINAFDEKNFDCKNIQYIVKMYGDSYTKEYGYTKEWINKSKYVQLKIWDSLITINPLFCFYKARADLKYEIEDYNGALADYMLLYRKSPENNYLVKAISDCYRLTGNYFDAIQYYSKAIEYNQNWNNDVKINSNSKISSQYLFKYRGDCKILLDDYIGGLKDYQLALSENNNFKDNQYCEHFSPLYIYNLLGKSRLLLKDYQNALVDLNKGIELANNGKKYQSFGNANAGIFSDITNDEFAYTYYLIGFAKINLNKKDDACLAWSKSGELGNVDAYKAIQENCK